MPAPEDVATPVGVEHPCEVHEGWGDGPQRGCVACLVWALERERDAAVSERNVAVAARLAAAGRAKAADERLAEVEAENARLRALVPDGDAGECPRTGGERDRYRDALAVELTHGGVADEIAQAATIVGGYAVASPEHWPTEVGDRLDRARVSLIGRLTAALAPEEGSTHAG